MKIAYVFKRFAIGVTVLAAILGVVMAVGVTQPSQALSKDELRRALLGTVRVAVAVEAKKDTYSTGSGTVLTADGFIMTNFHVMGDTKTGKLNNKQGLAYIAVNPTDLKGLPTWTYQAVMVKGDPKLDVAVLKITAPFKGGGSLPKNLGLVVVPLGDSDMVEIGDQVSAVGYPGIGGDSVTYTRGTIAGFLDEDGDKVNDWFKTDAEVNYGNSGGLAINDAGEMIGVPTAGVTDPETAGKISLVRPVNLALPLLKAAMAGSADGQEGKSTGKQAKSTGAEITGLIFTDTMDRSGKPGKAATNFITSTTTVYAVFEYSGFTDGKTFEFAWTHDGKPDVSDSGDWEGGASGSYWVSITNKRGIIAGAYELTLSLEGVELRKGRMNVGAAKTTTIKSKISTPIFAEDVSKDNLPVKPHKTGEPFAEGITALYGFFDYAGMEDGQAWSSVWYVDGEEVLRRDNDWEGGASGSWWLSLTHKQGLPVGLYKLEIYLGEDLAATGETNIGAQGARATTATDEGVLVTGTIVDADTKRPIPGAVFIVLQPGVDPAAFLKNMLQEDVFGIGEADDDGAFMLSALLERGVTYSLVAGANGYQAAFQKGYAVATDAESPLQFNIKLQKR